MPFGAASEWIARHALRIRAQGRVLDLACGSGRNARFLAGAGFRVLAVDRDRQALEALQGVAGVETRTADLETPDWPLAGERFDAVVVCRYLYRPRLHELAEALAPGGLLIYETFMLGNERFGRPSRPEFLLQPDELLDFARGEDLDVIEFRQGIVDTPQPAALQAICARRRA